MHSALATFKDDDPGYVQSISGAGVLASSHQKKDAERFVAFLVSPEGQGHHRPLGSFEYPLARGVATPAGDRPTPRCTPQRSASPSSGLGPSHSSCSRRPSCCGLARAAAAPVAPRRAWRHRSRPLPVAGWLVALIALAPIAFLVLEAFQSGWSALSSVLFRQLTATLILNTLEMTVLVTAVAAVLGVGAAWTLERTDVPLRRLFFVALLVPAAIPDFIETFGWVNVAPWLRGLSGSVSCSPWPSTPL